MTCNCGAKESLFETYYEPNGARSTICLCCGENPLLDAYKRQDLLDEKERLLSRLAEIDLLLEDRYKR